MSVSKFKKSYYFSKYLKYRLEISYTTLVLTNIKKNYKPSNFKKSLVMPIWTWYIYLRPLTFFFKSCKLQHPASCKKSIYKKNVKRYRSKWRTIKKTEVSNCCNSCESPFNDEESYCTTGSSIYVINKPPKTIKLPWLPLFSCKPKRYRSWFRDWYRMRLGDVPRQK